MHKLDSIGIKEGYNILALWHEACSWLNKQFNHIITGGLFSCHKGHTPWPPGPIPWMVLAVGTGNIHHRLLGHKLGNGGYSAWVQRLRCTRNTRWSLGLEPSRQVLQCHGSRLGRNEVDTRLGWVVDTTSKISIKTFKIGKCQMENPLGNLKIWRKITKKIGRPPGLLPSPLLCIMIYELVKLFSMVWNAYSTCHENKQQNIGGDKGQNHWKRVGKYVWE